MSITLIEKYTPTDKAVVTELDSEVWQGRTVWEAVPSDIRDSDVVVQVTVNTKELADEDLKTCVLSDGDRVALRVVPSGPLLPFVAQAFISLAIGAAVGQVVRLIEGQPRDKTTDTSDPSPVFGFDQVRTTTKNGTPKMVQGGKIRNPGHLIQVGFGNQSSAATNIVDLTIALGEGGPNGWQSIAGITSDVTNSTDFSVAGEKIFIGDQPVSEIGTSGLSYSVRLGTGHQLPVGNSQKQTVLETVPLGIFIGEVNPASGSQRLAYTALDSDDGNSWWGQAPFGVVSESTTYTTLDTITRARFTFRYSFLFQAGVAGPTGSFRQGPWLHYILVEWKYPHESWGAAGTNKQQRLDTFRFHRDSFDVSFEVDVGTPGVIEFRIWDWFEKQWKDIIAVGNQVSIDASRVMIHYVVSLIEVQEIFDDIFSYPGTAVFQLNAVASDRLHGDTPQISVVCEGPKIPVYTTPSAFTNQYTDNPSWLILWLLLDKEVGLGQIIDVTDVDIQSFIDAAAYCDELVSDGRGSTEKRAVLNFLIDTRKPAWDWLVDLMVSSGLVILRIGNFYSIKPDSSSSPVMMFSPANSHSLSINYIPPFNKVNFVEANIVNELDEYRPFLAVSLDDSITFAEQYVKETLELVGATRETQAVRIGDIRRRKNLAQSRFATWTTGIESVKCLPFDVVEVVDEAYLWGIFTGYIVSATSTTATLNKHVVLDATTAYRLRVYNQDGLFEEHSVTSTNGSFLTVTIGGVWAVVPTKYSVFTIGSGNNVVRSMRVISITRNAEYEAVISGVEYNASVYDDTIPDLEIVVPDSGFRSTDVPPDPTGLFIRENPVVQRDGSISSTVTIFWSNPNSPIFAFVNVWLGVKNHQDGGVIWGDTPVLTGVKGQTAVVPVVFDGSSTEAFLSVVPVSSFGNSKHPDDVPNVSIILLGKNALPEDVANFRVNRFGNALAFKWDPVGDKDLSHYRIKQGNAWSSGIVLGEDLRVTDFETDLFFADQTGGSMGAVSQTFMLKAVDTSGNESENETSLTVSVDPVFNSFVHTDDDHRADGWLDAKTNMTTGGADTDLDIDDESSPGIYDTGNVAIAGVAVRARLVINVVSFQADITADIQSATYTWDSTQAENRTWDGPLGVDGLTVLVEAKYGDSVAEIDAAAYEKFVPVERIFRYFRIRITLTLDDPSMTGGLEEFFVKVFAPKIVNEGSGLAVAATGTTTITFDDSYSNENTVTITVKIENEASGDYSTISNVTKTTFDIQTFSSGGQAARNITYQAQGF